ncbi:helix-turn-helix transcriptional regulator [Novosphingobium sp. BL-52-GroH]|uniref:helix-turn-helix transcriptional regulator n=1 Tax=Novosphingobium sp. BL-52-GroH TaxID=3349877 RepID=UPI0038512D25
MQAQPSPQHAAMMSAAILDNIVEGHASGASFDVQLHRTRWAEPGEGVFNPSMFFVEMILTRPLVRASYDGHAKVSDYRRLGDVTCIPSDTPLYCVWDAGLQRSISCMFDIEGLTTRAGMNWEWPSCDPMNSLAVGNDYVRAGLRRVAEEILAPGFASTMEIEIALMFVAAEVRRQLRRAPSEAIHCNATLSTRQLDRLCSMAKDIPGQGPCIEDLATVADMGVRQLARAYRNTTGTTLRSFVANARIERAKALLLEPGVLIKQVAFDTGFRSSAAFTAAFRKSTGRTPMEFRQEVGVGKSGWNGVCENLS